MDTATNGHLIINHQLSNTMDNKELKELERKLRNQKFNSKILAFEDLTETTLPKWLGLVHARIAMVYPASDISKKHVSWVFKEFVSTDKTLDQIISFSG